MSQNVYAILAEVAEKVNGSNSSVRQRVVDAYVEKEVSARADLLDKSLTKLVELDKSLKKCRPDIETYTADGVKTEAWSKKALDEKRKATERHAALEKAIAAVLDGGKDEWNKLREALQKAEKGGDNKSGNEE